MWLKSSSYHLFTSPILLPSRFSGLNILKTGILLPVSTEWKSAKVDGAYESTTNALVLKLMVASSTTSVMSMLSET